MSGSERSRALAAGDVEARRRACSEFVRPVALEAGAGTGKTTALVTRVLAWGLGPGWERVAAAAEEQHGAAPRAERIAAQLLDRVVAITFTEAAAAEMGARIGEALREVEAGRRPDWLRMDRKPTAVMDLPPNASARSRPRSVVTSRAAVAVARLIFLCRDRTDRFA